MDSAKVACWAHNPKTRFESVNASNGIIMEKFIVRFIQFAVEYGLFYVILGGFITAFARDFLRLFTSQDVYNDVLRSNRIKILISKLSANRALLGASRIVVTRIHNGLKWLNSEHMNKLSVYKTLSIENYNIHTKSRLIDSYLNDAKLSLLSDILIQVNEAKSSYEIISVEELPNDFEFKRVLKDDKVKYIALFKIAKQSRILGYIWVLFSGDAERDVEIYNDFKRVAAEIAEEFK